jgi:hypothetical protein
MDSSLPEDYWLWMLERLMRDTSASAWEERWSQFIDTPGVSDYRDDPGLMALKEYFDQRSDDERASLLDSGDPGTLLGRLTSEGVVAPAPVEGEVDRASSQPEEGYDEQAWQAFAQSYLAHWDGTDETWDQFREWILFYAAEQGLAAPAQRLIDYASQQTASERISTFAAYGVQVGPPAATQDSQDTERISAEQLESLLAEILAEHPEFEEIPAERRAELAAEVMASDDRA